MKAILITGDIEETKILHISDKHPLIYTPIPIGTQTFQAKTEADSTPGDQPVIVFELINKLPNGDLIYRRVK